MGIRLKNIFVVVVALVLSSLAAAQVTVVRAGRLIDPDSGTVLTNQVIMIKDGKIQAVGRELALPADAKWIDLSDKTVLPGLIDCHTHELFGRVPTSFLLRSDNGLVFTSWRYTALVRSYGLQQEFITPHCPEQNGMSSA